MRAELWPSILATVERSAPSVRAQAGQIAFALEVGAVAGFRQGLGLLEEVGGEQAVAPRVVEDGAEDGQARVDGRVRRSGLGPQPGRPELQEMRGGELRQGHVAEGRGAVQADGAFVVLAGLLPAHGLGEVVLLAGAIEAHETRLGTWSSGSPSTGLPSALGLQDHLQGLLLGFVEVSCSIPLGANLWTRGTLGS
jgi:hypothetical protein